ncbi:MAG: hypothetical protein AAF950_04980 [Pseudomonadota bacterium]
MHDLRQDLGKLWRAIGRLASVEGGQAIMFIAAKAGEGTSSVASSFAMMTAEKAHRPTWLVDLDLMENPLFEGFSEGFAEGVGRPGRPYDASLGAAPIYNRVGPARPRQASSEKMMSAHQIEGSRLIVTRYRTDRLIRRERLRISTRPDWWRALRRSADWIIVDAPAISVSGAGLAVAQHMDHVVLVVEADATRSGDVIALRQELERHSGHVLGVVMNRIAKDAHLIERLAS